MQLEMKEDFMQAVTAKLMNLANEMWMQQSEIAEEVGELPELKAQPPSPELEHTDTEETRPKHHAEERKQEKDHGKLETKEKNTDTEETPRSQTPSPARSSRKGMVEKPKQHAKERKQEKDHGKLETNKNPKQVQLKPTEEQTHKTSEDKDKKKKGGLKKITKKPLRLFKKKSTNKASE